MVTANTILCPSSKEIILGEREHIEALWEDIEDLGEDDVHYMGYIVLQEKKENRSFIIIDGQQRLTTFSLFILAAIKRLKDIGEGERAEELSRAYIGTKNIDTLEIKNRLKLNRNNDYYYREAVDGREIPRRGKKRTVHLMQKTMDYYYNRLKNREGDAIAKLILKIIHNLLFTTIYIGDNIIAYKVFETLNARGAQLSSGDLVKNYLFSCMDSGGYSGRCFGCFRREMV